MQLRVYILIFSCIFFFNSHAQNNDTLKVVEVHTKKDSILKLTVLNSNVPHYILNKNKLNELGADDIGDALKYIPGTYIKDYGSIGGLKTISYRSLGAAHTNIEVDGVILPNTQTATINLSSFDVFSVNKIEMTAGQVQNDFSTASSYVKANLISIKSSLFSIPKHKYELKLMGTASSINAYQGGIMYQQKIGNHFSIGLQSLYTFGSGKYKFSIQNIDSIYTATRQDSDLKNFNMKGALNYTKNNLKIHFNGSYQNNHQNLPGAIVFYNPYNDQNLITIKSNSTLNVQYATKQFAIGFNSFIQNSKTTYRDNQYLNQQGYLENNYYNQSIGAGAILNWFLNSKTQKIFIGSDFIHSFLWGDQFTSSPFRDNINSVIGFSKWLNKVKIQANINHQSIFDKTQVTKNQVSHFSPFISFAYIPLKKHNFRIRSHFKNTYRLPSFNDLFYNNIGNTNLKAENANSFNLGLTYGKKFKTISTETTLDLYQNNIRDKIVAIPTQNLFNWSMQNIGSVLSRGIDFNFLILKKGQHMNFTASTSQSFNSSIDITNINNITYGDQIPYTPKYTASYTATIQYKKTNLVLTLLQTTHKYVLNENLPFNQLTGFIDFGIGINRTFLLNTKKFYININLANLLNANYEVIKSFPMPGRHIRFKLVYSINK